MRHKHDPGARITDERIDELVRDLQQIPETRPHLADAPELRLASDILRAYHDETEQDRRSLERVFARLMRDQALARPKVISLPRMIHQQERISPMQNYTAQTSSQPQTGWKRRLTLLAAVLCMLVLVGGFLTLANAARANHTTGVGSQSSITPTPQPTRKPAAQVIQKAILTASTIGKGEGIGPGLSGIVPEDHFKVNQQFWLFFLVNEDHGGTVSAKWYADGHPYRSSSLHIPALTDKPAQQTPSPVPTPSLNSPGNITVPIESNFSITYNRPASGKVELYWNGQLAVTLSFVVS